MFQAISMKRLVAILTIALAVSHSASAFVDVPLDAAVQRLSKVGMFAFGGTGFAGVTSKGELDFKIVLARPEPEALAAFEKIYATGDLAGKAYALVGLKKLSPYRFKELLPAAEASTDELSTIRGCIVSHRLFADVAREIDRNTYPF
jgi:hypothetical protein